MVSGRDAVSTAWASMLVALSDDDAAAVRASRLTGTYGPTRRAKPLISRALPDWPVSHVWSGDHEFSDREAESIERALVEAAPRMAYAARLLTEVWTALREAGYGAGDDPVFTAVADTTFEQDAALGEAPSPLVVAELRDGLLRAAALSTASLAEAFADAAVADVLVPEALDAAWATRPVFLDVVAADRDQQRDAIGKFLREVGMRDGRPTVTDPAGLSAWQGLVDLDPPVVVLANLVSLGLSSTPVPERPEVSGADVGHSGDRAPLDRSIHARLWSVVSHAQNEWRHELPPIMDMIRLEAKASAQPLGLRTAHARAGLAVALHATFAVRQSMDAAASARLPEGVDYFRRRVEGFIASVGGRHRLTEHAENTLEDVRRDMLPELWTALHGLEYRRVSLVRDPVEVWGRVSGELNTVFKELRRRWKKRLDGHVVTTADGAPPAQPSPQEEAGVRSRDDRVDATRQHFLSTRGPKALQLLVTPLLRRGSHLDDIARSRGAWEAAADEIRRDASPLDIAPELAASWHDLRWYVRDHAVMLDDEPAGGAGEDQLDV